MPDDDIIYSKMRDAWDERARANYRHYIVNSQTDWSLAEFEKSGEETAVRYIDTDAINICQGKLPAQMWVLDFGCGAGRVTRALANRFGHVVGVDISEEMLRLARRDLVDLPTVEFLQCSGSDLGGG